MEQAEDRVLQPVVVRDQRVAAVAVDDLGAGTGAAAAEELDELERDEVGVGIDDDAQGASTSIFIGVQLCALQSVSWSSGQLESPTRQSISLRNSM
jgi:hypothetical protein